MSKFAHERIVREMARIFISYKRADWHKVKKIKEQIDSALHEKCWIDLDGIESDAQFKNVIINAINECEIMLFMYSSSHSKITDYEKDWTIRELNFAALKHKRIVFINLDRSKLTDQLEFDFGSKQQVDGTSQESISHLIRDLRSWLGCSRNEEDTPSTYPGEEVTAHKNSSERDRISKAERPKSNIKPLLATAFIIVIGVFLFLFQRIFNSPQQEFATVEEGTQVEQTGNSSTETEEVLVDKEAVLAIEEEPITNAINDRTMISGHEYSDLGLSVLWSTCNLGAVHPEDAGSFFAWGETSTKSRYGWSNLKYHSSTTSQNGHTFSKYINSPQFGSIDNRHMLESSDDAASVAWGNGWRTPSHNELNELRTSCNWVWTSRNGHCGFEVTSKTNNASIFIPAAGYQEDTDIIGKNSDGYLWSSEIYEGGRNAFYLYFKKGETDVSNMGRYLGLSIRPVHSVSTAE